MFAKKNKNQKKEVKQMVEETKEVTNVPVVETIKRKYKNYTFNVKINYKLGLISIVDDFDNPSVFKFQSRGLEYMEGWKEILANLSDLTSFAEAKLKAYQDERNEESRKILQERAEQVEGMMSVMFGLNG